MSFRSLGFAILAASFATLVGVAPARAVPVSPPATVLLSNVNSGGQSFTVGGLLFSFSACTGYCSSDVEILGVPASPSTGAGGGIILQSVDSAPIVSGPAAQHDTTLYWTVSVISGGSINGVSGSAVGTQGTGTGSIGTQIYNGPGYTVSPGTLTTPINVSTQALTLTLLQSSLGMVSDINVTSGGTTSITTGTILISQVPEPASVAMLLAGVVGLAASRRKTSRLQA